MTRAVMWRGMLSWCGRAECDSLRRVALIRIVSRYSCHNLRVGVEASSGESPALPRRRVGSVRAALRKALAARRSTPGWSAAHDVSAAVALRFAEEVDQAGDSASLVKASQQLAELMETLGLTPGQGVTPGDGDGGSRGPDERARLHAVMDGPPAVGDAAHS